MEQIRNLIDKSTETVGRSIAWLAVLLVLATGLVVVLRYVFQTGSIALQESLLYINALFFTLGSAYTLKHDGHVRVDIFYNRFTPKQKALLNLFGCLVFLMPFCILVLWFSWDYVTVSWRIQEGSPETSGLQFVYLLKTTILLLAGFLIWQGVAEIAKNLDSLKHERHD